MMRKRRGSILMLLGLALIAGAAFLTFKNQSEENFAGQESERILETVQKQVLQSSDSPADEPEPGEVPAFMQTTLIDGREYIGVLDIPALEVSLPVQLDLDDPGLKISPCRFSGSYLTNDMIIGAHNYRAHFGYFGRLDTGDEVTFTDLSGTKYVYQIIGIERLGYNNAAALQSGEWDLTLFTCTKGGQYRITVRCKLMHME